MSRIRSIHPGLWTDERFASLTPLARLLFIGIWTECDDQGSFEWSPLKLKMRLLPADVADVAALLTEIEAAGCVISYELEGRKLGAVRNFCRYQRPKKPNSTYLQTDEVRNYVALHARITRDGSEPVGNQSGTDGGNPRLMKEEGGRRERRPSVSSREVVSAATRGTRLPSDFSMPPEWIQWALDDQGLSRTDAIREGESFVDFWHGKPGKDGVKVDWLATWRNWCRRSDRPRSNGKGKDPDDPRMLGGGRLNSPC
jgi:hypothetical protein